MRTNELTRRAFLAVSTFAATGAAWPQQTNTARVVPKKISPNEKLNIAAIGVGGKGFEDTMMCRNAGENIVALCDPDWRSAEHAFSEVPDAKRFKDYREMLDKMPEIDACTISTPDHTHAPAAYRAIKLGKHVYVQKPLTHTIAEARLLTRTAAEAGVATQMGNQRHCSDSIREFCEMLWDGAVGQVREVHLWTDRPVWPQGIPEALPEQPVPDTMDWDLWLGAAPARPYNPGYAPFKWRGWWDFGTGALGDIAAHTFDLPFWALRLGDAPNFSVECVEQDGNSAQTYPNTSILKFTFPARKAMDAVEVYWYDGKLKPPSPEGVPPEAEIAAAKSGLFFVGENGVLASGGDEWAIPRLLPEDRAKDYKKPDPVIPRIPGENSYVNWIQACKGGTPAASNFSYSGALTETLLVGNLTLRVPEKLDYDVSSGQVTNAPEANKYLGKEYRPGWELPC